MDSGWRGLGRRRQTPPPCCFSFSSMGSLRTTSRWQTPPPSAQWAHCGLPPGRLFIFYRSLIDKTNIAQLQNSWNPLTLNKVPASHIMANYGHPRKLRTCTPAWNRASFAMIENPKIGKNRPTWTEEAVEKLGLLLWTTSFFQKWRRRLRHATHA